MTYNELDINARINLKGVLQDWTKYSIQGLQASVEKVVYGVRINKKGVGRSLLGKGYRFGTRRTTRTNALRQTWSGAAQGERVMIEFLMYGRYLDMGVGRGTSHTDRVVTRQLRLGQAGRQRKPWYAKQKSYQIHRLRELLAERHIQVSADFIESALSLTLKMSI